MKFSIIIPAHNEEHRLPVVLEAFSSLFAKEMGDEAEIIVVVNGSSDETNTVAEAIAAKHSNIKVIDEPRKIGKGGAVILGAKNACGEYIGFVDADGATSADEFFRLYERAHNTDGVIASRWLRESDVSIPQKGLRLFSSRIFNLLIRTVLGLKYKDTQCGAKIFKAEAWHKILPSIGITRFAFDVDLLFQLKRNSYQISEEPTTWCDVEGSKVNVLSSSFDMFSAVIRMRLLYSPFRIIVRWYERFLAKAVEFLRRDELFCHASMLFMASITTHICNISYQMIVSRALSEADYALLATFLSLLAIITRPLGTLSSATTHYTSLLLREGRSGAVRRLAGKWLVIAGLPSLVVGFVCILFARQISAYFHLDRIAPVVVTAAAIPALFLLPVVAGILRGMQRFGWTAWAAIAGAAGRFTVGAGLVLLLVPACGWALLGHTVGIYLTLLVSVVALYFVMPRHDSDNQPLPSLRLYLIQCFFIQFSLALLLTGDVVFVKHFLPDETNFAYAATLGRMVVFLTGAITAAMFPKVSSSGAFTLEHRRIYLRGLAYTSFFIIASLVACFAFPALLHRFLFRVTEASSEMLWQTRWMAVVMGLSTLLGINISLLLAQRRFKAASVVCITAMLYFGGVQVFHESSFSIIIVSGVCNLIALLCTTGFILTQKTTDE